MSDHQYQPSEDAGDIYDLRDEPSPLAPAVREDCLSLPDEGVVASPPDGAVDLSVEPERRASAASVMAAIPRRRGLRSEPVAPSAPASSFFRDILLPIALIAAGLIAATFAGTHSNGQMIPFHSAIGPIMLNVLGGLALAVAAVFGASIMGGISFHEPRWQIILKLCAVALLPGPLGAMADQAVDGMYGTMAGVFLSVALYFALFWAVFRLTWSDRIICVMLIWIIRTGVSYLIFRLTGAMKGTPI